MEISASGRSLPPPRLTLDRSGDLPCEPHRVMLGGGARGDGRAARKRKSGQNTSNPPTKVNLRSTGSKMTCFWRTLHIKHVEPHRVMWYGHLPVSRAGISHRLFEQSKPLRSKNLFDGISALGRAWRTHGPFGRKNLKEHHQSPK